MISKSLSKKSQTRFIYLVLHFCISHPLSNQEQPTVCSRFILHLQRLGLYILLRHLHYHKILHLRDECRSYQRVRRASVKIYEPLPTANGRFSILSPEWIRTIKRWPCRCNTIPWHTNDYPPHRAPSISPARKTIFLSLASRLPEGPRVTRLCAIPVFPKTSPWTQTIYFLAQEVPLLLNNYRHSETNQSETFLYSMRVNPVANSLQMPATAIETRNTCNWPNSETTSNQTKGIWFSLNFNTEFWWPYLKSQSFQQINKSIHVLYSFCSFAIQCMISMVYVSRWMCHTVNGRKKLLQLVWWVLQCITIKQQFDLQ